MTTAPSTMIRIFGAALVSVALAAGCQPTRQFAPKVEQDGKFLVHIVTSPKEEIGPLCAWYSGEQGCEAIIAQENPGLNLASLQVGDRILVPFGILRRVERYQAGATPPPLDSSPAPAPTPAPTPPEASVEATDPLVGDNFQDLPQRPRPAGESPSSAGEGPSGDPLEQLMRDQEEMRRQQPQAPAGLAEQAVPVTPTLETFDLQDAAEASESRPPQEARPGEVNAPAKSAGTAQRAGPAEPVIEQPAVAGEQIEELRRELGLAQ